MAGSSQSTQSSTPASAKPGDSPSSPGAGVVQVVIASPLRRHFDYLPENNKLASDYPTGARVRVPFGRRHTTGVVMGHSSHSKIEASKLKAIHSSLDSQPALDNDLLDLAQWMSNYYHHPHGDTGCG